jgi:hypothetical protein
MYGPLIRLVPVKWLLGGLLFCGACCATSEVRAQPQTAGKGGQPTDSQVGQGKAPATQKTEGRGAGAARGGGRAAGVAGRGGEPSAAYQESLRQTVERRRQRRARRQQHAGDSSAAIGAIVPWPMSPALIIRHTRDVHDEVGSLLYGLRR